MLPQLEQGTMILNYQDRILRLCYRLLDQVADLEEFSSHVTGPLLSAVFLMLALLPLTIWLYHRPPNLFRYLPDEHAPKWRGLHGLLIPLLILITAEIPRAVSALWAGRVLLRREVWSLLCEGAEPFSHPTWAILINLHFSSNALRLLFAGLLLATFLARRRVFRNLMIAYILFDNVLLCVRYLILNSVYEGNKFAFTYESFTDWSESTQIAILLIPYLMISRRIHATFHR